MKILSAEQIRALDRHTIAEEPIASIDLMERAAAKLLDALIDGNYIRKTDSIMLFCGMGNNGGDGLALARMLIEQGYLHVTVYVVRHSPMGSPDFELNEKRLKNISGFHFIETELQIPIIPNNAVVIDAIFGSGLSRPVEGISKSVIRHINISGAQVYSVDVPSGLYCDEANNDTDTVIQSKVTFTFHAPKLSFMLPASGAYVSRFKVLDIGLSKAYSNNLTSAYWYTTPLYIRSEFKEREKFSHKGTFGHALIAAGSYGKIGASVLSVRGALRSGAGLVSALIPACGYDIMQTSCPEAMVMTGKQLPSPLGRRAGDEGDVSNYEKGYKDDKGVVKIDLFDKKEKLDSGLLENARNLRKRITKPEELMWELLRNRRFLNLKFRRQHPIKLGYILDFYCDEYALGIEIDGENHERSAIKENDQLRTDVLSDLGIDIIRFTNDEVLKETENVLAKIANAIAPHPQPLSLRERGVDSCLSTTSLSDIDITKYTTIGVGPGIGTTDEAVAFLEGLLKLCKQPLVVDADALNILSDNNELLQLLPANSILTPHPGEFKRLAGEWTNDLDKLDKLKAFAAKYNVVMVLKGANTCVASADGGLHFNSTGNAGMAKGGSGDVLTGVITALLAQGYSPLNAAIIGVYMHGLAGDYAAENLGQTGMHAGDIIAYLPKAFKQFE